MSFACSKELAFKAAKGLPIQRFCATVEMINYQAGSLHRGTIVTKCANCNDWTYFSTKILFDNLYRTTI